MSAKFTKTSISIFISILIFIIFCHKGGGNPLIFKIWTYNFAPIKIGERERERESARKRERNRD